MARDLRERLSEALRRAITERDTVAVTAFRSALAAIANAEAVEGSPNMTPRLGVGAGESARKDLSDEELARIVTAEVAERIAAAMDYERRGRPEPARRLRREAAALEPYL